MVIKRNLLLTTWCGILDFVKIEVNTRQFSWPQIQSHPQMGHIRKKSGESLQLHLMCNSEGLLFYCQMRFRGAAWWEPPSHDINKQRTSESNALKILGRKKAAELGMLGLPKRRSRWERSHHSLPVRCPLPSPVFQHLYSVLGVSPLYQE